MPKYKCPNCGECRRGCHRGRCPTGPNPDEERRNVNEYLRVLEKNDSRPDVKTDLPTSPQGTPNTPPRERSLRFSLDTHLLETPEGQPQDALYEVNFESQSLCFDLRLPAQEFDRLRQTIVDNLVDVLLRLAAQQGK